MKIVPRILAVCACSIFFVALPSEVAAQEGAGALVEEIRGTVFWRRNARAKQVRLDQEADKVRRLYPGEQVRCARGSVLLLWLGHEIRTIPATGWFTIPPLSAPPSGPIRRMVNYYGGPSGIDRANAIKVFSPSHHGASLPKPFVMRWIPTVPGCTLSFLIQDVVGYRVWRKHNIAGVSGSLNDTSAEQALIDYRTRNGQGTLTLTVNDSCGSRTPVSFSLLSAADEQALTEELAFWDTQTGAFAPHLGRASVYDRYRMFPQAAEEYEATLKVAPGSRHLLMRAITAHRATGNFARVGELKKRLPK